MKVAIIDADSLIWVAAYNARDGSVDDAIVSLDSQITDILIATGATHYIGFVQGKEKSYRHRMFRSYKANRPEKPVWLDCEDTLKSHANRYWGFQRVEGVESDDAVATAAACEDSLQRQYVVVGNDKDLRQISGPHYNPQKKEFFYVTESEAVNWMLTQILTGDGTDNIKGVPGIGPKKAGKVFKDHLEDSYGMGCLALTQYMIHHSQSLPSALIDFAENVLKVVLKIDLNLQDVCEDPQLREVPETIQQLAKQQENRA